MFAAERLADAAERQVALTERLAVAVEETARLLLEVTVSAVYPLPPLPHWWVTGHLMLILCSLPVWPPRPLARPFARRASGSPWRTRRRGKTPMSSRGLAGGGRKGRKGREGEEGRNGWVRFAVL